MCTNFVPSTRSILQQRFGVPVPDFSFRDEAWPGYLAPFIRQDKGGERECVPAVFGLIPSWSRDGKNYRFCYNARSETVAEKPSFRRAWRETRFGIAPVDAFFEPSYESGRAVRWRIERDDGNPMGLAAIWDAWRRPASTDGKKRPGPAELDQLTDEWVISFSLLTVNADKHPVMNRFHRPGDEKRSVVMLPDDQFDNWMGSDIQSARDFLHTADPALFCTLEAPLKPRKNKAEPPPKPVRKLL